MRSGAGAPVIRRLPWVHIAGTLFGLAALAWLLSDHQFGDMLRVVRNIDLQLLTVCVPVIALNMILRAVRWRAFLGSRDQTRFRAVFSALMIGYLGNAILPARVGDLIRIYVLGNNSELSHSRVLASVVLERILDMASVVVVLGLIALAIPLPSWMQYGAASLVAATILCLVALFVADRLGDRMVRGLLKWINRWAPRIALHLRRWAKEFAAGIQRCRNPVVGVVFLSTTSGIWMLEIVLVAIVAHSLGLALGVLDAAVLMMFSLFSSLIPALPGQLGTFELAMVTGLKFLGVDGPASLPFALTLHFLLLSVPAAFGIACLFVNGLPLLPQRLLSRAAKA